MRMGVITGARRVVMVVIPTENATSPLQRKLMMLEETPPGQHPTSKSPTATGCGRLRALATVQAMSGIKRYCAVTPMSISVG